MGIVALSTLSWYAPGEVVCLELTCRLGLAKALSTVKSHLYGRISNHEYEVELSLLKTVNLLWISVACHVDGVHCDVASNFRPWYNHAMNSRVPLSLAYFQVKNPSLIEKRTLGLKPNHLTSQRHLKRRERVHLRIGLTLAGSLIPPEKPQVKSRRCRPSLSACGHIPLLSTVSVVHATSKIRSVGKTCVMA